MIKAQKSDKATVTDILSGAFSENRSVNYLIPQDDQKMQRIRKLMAYSFDICFAFGEVYLSDCRRACALVLYPGRKRITLQSIWWDIRLAITVFGLSRTFKVLSREQLINKHHPTGNIFYCWYIGVQKGFQRTGTGRAVVESPAAEKSGAEAPGISRNQYTGKCSLVPACRV